MAVDRREFLRTASLAAGAAGVSMTGAADALAAQAPATVTIGKPAYQHVPARDFAIQPHRFSEVTLTDKYWKPKVDRNASVTIPLEVHKFEDGEREFGGNILEAAIMSLKTHPDPALQRLVDAQIKSTLQGEGRGNNGFEVAATYFNATGSRSLIDRAIVAADALYKDFQARNPPFSGGERDATNCIALYRVTRDKRHLDLAKHYLDIRGLPSSVNRSRHNQSYRPVLEQREAVGHAVNAATLMVSMADVGVLTGLPEYLSASRAMWTDAVEKKLYITGGVGTTGNEGFGAPYSLPNISAYAETCAVLMFMTLSHRLFLATGDSRFIDVMERGMYNNAIDGVSLGGDRFFYVNRLASAGDGRDARWLRASLECCPPNLVRFLASMPGLMYARGPASSIYVNLYAGSYTVFDVAGAPLTLAVESSMPWNGGSKIAVTSAGSTRAAIKLRIPGWARNQAVPGSLYSYTTKMSREAAISVNGKPVPATPDLKGYVTIERVWGKDDHIEIDLPMEPRRVATDARVKENRGKLAVERGPLVYAVESPDVPSVKVFDLYVEPQAALTAGETTDFGGATVIRTEGRRLSRPEASAAVTMIPYYAWANRGASEMSVWIPSREYAAGDVGPSGGFIFYVNPNYAKDGWRYLEAAPYDQSAGAKWGCFRTQIQGARGTAIGTGRQNTLDMLAACGDAGTAAQLCSTLDVRGVKGWFLPSRDELVQMYKALRATNVADFGDRGVADNFSYWASSQLTADMAAHVDFADLGRPHFDDKDFPRRVRAVRAF